MDWIPIETVREDALERLEAWKGNDESRSYNINCDADRLGGAALVHLRWGSGKMDCTVWSDSCGFVAVGAKEPTRWHTGAVLPTIQATIHAALDAAERAETANEC